MSVEEMAKLWKDKYDKAKAERDEADRKLKHAENMLTYWLIRMEQDGKRLDEEKGRRSS